MHGMPLFQTLARAPRCYSRLLHSLLLSLLLSYTPRARANSHRAHQCPPPLPRLNSSLTAQPHRMASRAQIHRPRPGVCRAPPPGLSSSLGRRVASRAHRSTLTSARRHRAVAGVPSRDRGPYPAPAPRHAARATRGRRTRIRPPTRIQHMQAPRGASEAA